MKSMVRSDVTVIVLTRNAGTLFEEWIRAVQAQTIQAGRYVVIDSQSTDQTVELAHAAGLEVHVVCAQTFDHGGTRQWAAELCAEANYLVYLTQDAILKQPNALELLLAEFNDPAIALAFGRHVPRVDADILEQHTRLFNYPAQSATYDRSLFKRIGYRAAFSSDVYAAYRTQALLGVGGFPRRTIVSEDSVVAARLLLAGWKSVYCARSCVEHSHRYAIGKLFQRYFDIGVFHACEANLMQLVGQPERDSGQYVHSLIQYLWLRRKRVLPLAALHTFVKLMGFRLGKRHKQLPAFFCKKISLQKAYWEGEHAKCALQPLTDLSQLGS